MIYLVINRSKVGRRVEEVQMPIQKLAVNAAEIVCYSTDQSNQDLLLRQHQQVSYLGS